MAVRDSQTPRLGSFPNGARAAAQEGSHRAGLEARGGSRLSEPARRVFKGADGTAGRIGGEGGGACLR